MTANMKTCNHCGREVEYNEGLQRYEHLDTHYDACATTFTENNPNRAEPRR